MTTSIALVEDGKILGEYTVSGQVSHSERVMKMMEELFEKVALKVSDVDLFVAGRGPGSFTGLRIGITTIKTLAQALNKEAMSISSLEAMAYMIPVSGMIVPILDARRERVYCGIYTWKNGELETIMEDTVMPWEELITKISTYKDVYFTGVGVEDYKEKIEQLKNVASIPKELHQIRASALCSIAQQKYSSGFRESLYEIAPNYVKKSQAEREYEARINK